MFVHKGDKEKHEKKGRKDGSVSFDGVEWKDEVGKWEKEGEGEEERKENEPAKARNRSDV